MKMLLKRELLEAKIVALEARASRRWSRSAKGCAAVLGGFAQGIGRGLSLQTFDTVEEFRRALLAFREVYKNTRLLDGTGSRRPPPCASASFPRGTRRVGFTQGVSQSEGDARVSNPFGGFAPLSKATLGARSAGRLWPVPCDAACCPVTLRSDAR